MRLGVLDVGSNTVHLLVVDAHLGAHPWPAHSEKSVLRLSEQIKPDGRLSREGADALVSAVKEARRSTERLQTDDLLAFATSAVREATNQVEKRGDFIRNKLSVSKSIVTIRFYWPFFLRFLYPISTA